MALLTTFVLITIITVVLYFYNRWSQTYWKLRSIPFRQKDLTIGNSLKEIKRISTSDVYLELYSYAKSKGYKHIGRFFLNTPTYFPIDLDIVKHILQADFNNFVNRASYLNEKDDPVSAHLMLLRDDKWRRIRQKLTPTFTSGKVKMGLPLLLHCSNNMIAIFREHSVTKEPIDAREVASRFSTDVIGSFGFGMEFNSLQDPNSEFRRYGKLIFDPPFRFPKLRAFFIHFIPHNILLFLKFKRMHSDISNFFLNTVRKTVEYREKNNIIRKDFLHMLIQLKNKGEVTDDDSITKETNNNKPANTGQSLSIEEISAQCCVFFGAGFETTANTITSALLELAIYQDVQHKLREDIINVLDKYNQELTYEYMKEMKYLDRVVQETLRKHPPIFYLSRECKTQYKIPGTGGILDPGTKVVLPTLAIHMDPEYYPEPEKFDPERFNEENKAKRPAYSYMPFGDGPRRCIAGRFALMEVKVALISIIKHFRFTVNERTKLPIQYKVVLNFINVVKDGAWLNIEKIENEKYSETL